jgi:hypothetical protein
MSEKRCWRCKLAKPEDDFDWRVDRSKGRKAACRDCENFTGDKICGACLQVKPKTAFHWQKVGKYLQRDCKDCQRVTGRHYRLARYNLTIEDYQRLLEKQGGVCAICGGPPTPGRNYHVDHDHACCPGDRSCGKCVRGLLCDGCNTALGLFRDRQHVLVRAANYIRLGGTN